MPCSMKNWQWCWKLLLERWKTNTLLSIKTIIWTLAKVFKTDQMLLETINQELYRLKSFSLISFLQNVVTKHSKKIKWKKALTTLGLSFLAIMKYCMLPGEFILQSSRFCLTYLYVSFLAFFNSYNCYMNK